MEKNTLFLHYVTMKLNQIITIRIKIQTLYFTKIIGLDEIQRFMPLIITQTEELYFCS